MVLSWPIAAVAQKTIERDASVEKDAVDAENNTSPANTATSLEIPPRFTIDYNSSGGGYDGFGGVEFMLPVQWLVQTVLKGQRYGQDT